MDSFALYLVNAKPFAGTLSPGSVKFIRRASPEGLNPRSPFTHLPSDTVDDWIMGLQMCPHPNLQNLSIWYLIEQKGLWWCNLRMGRWGDNPGDYSRFSRWARSNPMAPEKQRTLPCSSPREMWPRKIFQRRKVSGLGDSGSGSLVKKRGAAFRSWKMQELSPKVPERNTALLEFWF